MVEGFRVCDQCRDERAGPEEVGALKDEREQKIVRESGALLSVGFDGHRVEDYLPERVKSACHFLEEKGLGAVTF